MNNRIMATLFALAIVLFIGVVPVKAEAAHTHVDKNNDCICDTESCKETCHDIAYRYDAEKHTQYCKKCGVQRTAQKHDNVVYAPTADGTQHTAECKTCGWKATLEHSAKNGECRCEDCQAIMEHQLQQHSDEVSHWQTCTNCGTVVNAAAHTPEYESNGDGTHNIVYTCCGRTSVMRVTCSDVSTDKDCVCDLCSGAVSTHNPNSLKKVAAKNATCTVDGNHEHYECTICHALFWDAEGTKATTAEKVTITATGHAEQSGWSTDGERHWKECEICGAKTTEATAHEMEWKDAGKDHYQECKICGYDAPEEEHNWIYASNGDSTHKRMCSVCERVEGYAEACTDSTTDNDCVCDKCGGEVLPHNTQSLKYVSAKGATCTEDGHYGYWECRACHALFWDENGQSPATMDDLTIQAEGHKASTKFYSDEENHWHICKNTINGEMCSVKLEVEAHESEMISNATVHRLKCKVCGEYLTDEEDHDWVRTSNGDGTHKTVCSVCGYVNGNANKCQDADGDCVCDYCGGTIKHELAALKTVSAKAPTCTVKGYEEHYKCTNCNKLFNAQGIEITLADVTVAAKGHSWEAKAYTENGTHQMECTVCGITRVMGHYSNDGDCYCDVTGCTQPVHSHKLVEIPAVAATCDQPGTAAYQKWEGCDQLFDMNGQEISEVPTVPATGHDYSGSWVSNGDYHERMCAECGELLERGEHTDANGDNRCDVCKVELSLKYVPQQDPTCTDIGYKEYWISTTTGKKYADADGNEYITALEVIPALGHDLSIWTSNGQGGHEQHCLRDGCTYSYLEAHRNTLIGCVCDVCGADMPGHQTEDVAEVAATCMKDGTAAYIKCSCGKMFDLTLTEIKKPVTISKTGHKLSNELVEDSKNGDHYQVCTNAGCDYEYHTDHEPVVEDPLKGNYHQWICECGNVETERHYDKDGDNKCDECGHDMANTSVNVQNHDSVTVVTGEKKTVNNQKSWWQNWLDNLLPSNAGGTSTTAASASNDSASTSGSGNTTSGGSTAADTGSGTTNSGSTASGSGSTTSNGSGSTSSGTGIINEFIQWLSQLFGSWLQGK